MTHTCQWENLQVYFRVTLAWGEFEALAVAISGNSDVRMWHAIAIPGRCYRCSIVRGLFPCSCCSKKWLSSATKNPLFLRFGTGRSEVQSQAHTLAVLVRELHFIRLIAQVARASRRSHYNIPHAIWHCLRPSAVQSL